MSDKLKCTALKHDRGVAQCGLRATHRVLYGGRKSGLACGAHVAGGIWKVRYRGKTLSVVEHECFMESISCHRCGKAMADCLLAGKDCGTASVKITPVIGSDRSCTATLEGRTCGVTAEARVVHDGMMIGWSCQKHCTYRIAGVEWSNQRTSVDYPRVSFHRIDCSVCGALLDNTNPDGVCKGCLDAGGGYASVTGGRLPDRKPLIDGLPRTVTRVSDIQWRDVTPMSLDVTSKSDAIITMTKNRLCTSIVDGVRLCHVTATWRMVRGGALVGWACDAHHLWEAWRDRGTSSLNLEQKRLTVPHKISCCECECELPITSRTSACEPCRTKSLMALIPNFKPSPLTPLFDATESRPMAVDLGCTSIVGGHLLLDEKSRRSWVGGLPCGALPVAQVVRHGAIVGLACTVHSGEEWRDGDGVPVVFVPLPVAAETAIETHGEPVCIPGAGATDTTMNETSRSISTPNNPPTPEEEVTRLDPATVSVITHTTRSAPPPKVSESIHKAKCTARTGVNRGGFCLADTTVRVIERGVPVGWACRDHQDPDVEFSRGRGWGKFYRPSFSPVSCINCDTILSDVYSNGFCDQCAAEPTRLYSPTPEVTMSTQVPSENPAAARVASTAAVLTTIVDDASDAAMRTAGSQFVKLARDPIVALLTRHLGPDDPSLRVRIAAFLETELGNAILASLLSVGLSTMPTLIGAEAQQRVARELRIRAMSGAGDVIADVLMGPLRQVVSAYLQGDPAAARQMSAGPMPVIETTAATPVSVSRQG